LSYAFLSRSIEEPKDIRNPATPEGTPLTCRRKMIMSYLRKVEMSY
jgi:hypothetical protein